MTFFKEKYANQILRSTLLLNKATRHTKKISVPAVLASLILGIWISHQQHFNEKIRYLNTAIIVVGPWHIPVETLLIHHARQSNSHRWPKI
jgi:flagellar biosynthesis protein FliQ